MNNLTTRKIVLGMLMALVLTFSVQGIADAQTFTESSGDHQNQVPDLTFTSPLVFTVTGIEANPKESVEYTSGTIADFTSITGTREAFGITSSSGLTIKSVTISGKTAHNVNLLSSVPLNLPYGTLKYAADNPATTDVNEAPTSAQKTAAQKIVTDYNNERNTLRVGSNTISVVCEASTAGVKTLTVSSLKFTLYASAPADSGDKLIDSGGSPDTNGEYSNIIKHSAEGEIIFATSGTADGNLVDFTVTSGGGRLYFDNDDRNRAQNRQTVGLDGSNGDAKIRFRPPSSGVTIVQASLRGTNQRAYQTFYSSFPNAAKVDDVTGRTGVVGTRLPDPFIVEVRDGETGTRVPNQSVKFALSFDATIPDNTELTSAADSTKTHATELILQSDRQGRAAVYLTMGRQDPQSPGDPRTDVGTYTLTVMLQDSAGSPWDTERFTATSVDEVADAIIEKVSGDKQRVDPESGAHPSQLVVQVLNRNRQIVQGTPVTFRATVGTVTGNPKALPSGSSSEGQFVTQLTDEYGRAAVTFVIGDTTGDAEVRVVINPATQHEQAVTFTIYGRGGAPTPAPTPDPGPTPEPETIIREVAPPEPRLIIAPSTLTGGPGSTYKLTIRAVDASGTAVSVPRVAVSNLAFIQAGGQVSPVTITAPITANVTLPSTPGQYKLSAAATGYQDATVDITVAAGTLSVLIDPVGGAPGTRSTVTVTATNAGGRTRNVSVTLGITTGGGTLSPSLVTTNTSGTAISILTRGRALGDNYFVTATADGYTQRSVLAAGERVVISETQPLAPGSTPPAQTGASGVAADLDAYDGNQQVGSLNSPLPEPIVVEVVDANDNPVRDVRVRFRTTIGSGRFSPRTPRTDEEGLAEATFTPTSTGRIRIVATVAGVTGSAAFIVQGGEPADALEKVSGDNQSGTPGNALANPFVVEVQDEDGEPLAGHRVTFEVTAGGGSLSATTDTTNASGRAQTTLTLGSERAVNSVQASVSDLDPVTFNTSIDPVVHVAAANRPVMYWIDGGMLYRLASAKAEQIAANASDVAVDAAGGKIYWTEKTSNNTGKIHSANLDGSGAQVLKDLPSLPYGLALDSANGKLYLTNSRSKIRRMNIDGTQFEANFIQGLSAPMNIAVSSGRVYWTEEGGNVRFANVEGTKVVRDIATGSGTLGGIAIGGNKVYWTEQTDETTGRVRSANLNGTGVAEVITLTTVPHGIAVDIADGKIFWADNQGRIQRIRIDNLKLLNVVTGLMAPSALALGVANTADATPPAATPVTKDTSVYDVNGDGTVDNTDAGLVANALGTTDAKYDVNDDGNVNFLDLLLVFDNREEAAGAPTVGRARLTAVQVDRIQEQIDLLLGMNDRSPGALYALQYLQSLLAVARPEKTQLLANYPNPFNPETWIPYHLSEDADVNLTIYDISGEVVRDIDVGHQTAAKYDTRAKAIYWDGRNRFGEQVASGLYFYSLIAGDFSATRKMVILK
jgi:hypothetical protein